MQTILFSAGGTLGHIYPALSFIHFLKAKNPNYRILFFATSKDQRYDVLKNDPDIDKIYWFDVCGIPKKITKLPSAFLKNIKSYKKIKEIIAKEKVDFSVGMGGYISGITIYAASKLNIHTAIHEQNSVFGFANKMVLRETDLIFTSFKTTKIAKKYQEKVKWIGNPRYDSAKEKKQSIYHNTKQILITSGSLGSKIINDQAVAFLNSIEAKKYTTTLITGPAYYDEVVKKVKPGYHYQIHAFTNQMLEEFSKASIVISRAGSTTLFEILAMQKVAIVIPSPNVTKNHQYFNALDFYNEGLIELVTEKDLIENNLYTYIKKIEQSFSTISSHLNNYHIDNVSDAFYQAIQPFLEKENKNDQKIY